MIAEFGHLLLLTVIWTLQGLRLPPHAVYFLFIRAEPYVPLFSGGAKRQHFFFTSARISLRTVTKATHHPNIRGDPPISTAGTRTKHSFFTYKCRMKAACSASRAGASRSYLFHDDAKSAENLRARGTGETTHKNKVFLRRESRNCAGGGGGLPCCNLIITQR